MHILRFADATWARGQADATGARGRLGGVDGQIRSGRYREREGEAWQGKREKNGLGLVCILEFLKCVF